jgi:hypothetical protein
MPRRRPASSCDTYRIAPASRRARYKARLGRLRPGEQFAYTVDLGDNWQHLCTVALQRVDPLETLGIIPVGPLPCWGWGDIPDQYGRRWDGDDSSSPMPKAPNGLADLPPILPGWGPRRTRPATSPADAHSTIHYRDLITLEAGPASPRHEPVP